MIDRHLMELAHCIAEMQAAGGPAQMGKTGRTATVAFPPNPHKKTVLPEIHTIKLGRDWSRADEALLIRAIELDLREHNWEASAAPDVAFGGTLIRAVRFEGAMRYGYRQVHQFEAIAWCNTWIGLKHEGHFKPGGGSHVHRP